MQRGDDVIFLNSQIKIDPPPSPLELLLLGPEKQIVWTGFYSIWGSIPHAYDMF